MLVVLGREGGEVHLRFAPDRVGGDLGHDALGVGAQVLVGHDPVDQLAVGREPGVHAVPLAGGLHHPVVVHELAPSRRLHPPPALLGPAVDVGVLDVLLGQREDVRQRPCERRRRCVPGAAPRAAMATRTVLYGFFSTRPLPGRAASARREVEVLDAPRRRLGRLPARARGRHQRAGRRCRRGNASGANGGSSPHSSLPSNFTGLRNASVSASRRSSRLVPDFCSPTTRTTGPGSLMRRFAPARSPARRGSRRPRVRTRRSSSAESSSRQRSIRAGSGGLVVCSCSAMRLSAERASLSPQAGMSRSSSARRSSERRW